MKTSLSCRAAVLLLSCAILVQVPWALAADSDLSFRQISLKAYDHVDPKGIVPDKPLRQALTYFEKYKSRFPNKEYMVVIDFTKHSSRDRFFLINLKTGNVETYVTSHGKGSDPNNTGYAKKFSNTSGSKATSLGFYRTAGTYYGDNGRSMRLDGLSSTNSNARSRAIVVHGASYVSESSRRAGRSWGCPALDNGVRDRVIDRIKNGALLYAWAGQ